MEPWGEVMAHRASGPAMVLAELDAAGLARATARAQPPQPGGAVVVTPPARSGAPGQSGLCLHHTVVERHGWSLVFDVALL